VNKVNNCYKCNKSDEKLYPTFGKLICKECLDKRKTGIKGHSGMIYKSNTNEKDYYLDEFKDIELKLVKVKKSNCLFVKWFIEHYPESKGIVGRQLNFLIYYYGKPIGIIGFASPPLNYKIFNNYFNLNPNDKRGENAKKFLNNNVFRIVYSKKNLGTKILKMARNIIYKLYFEQYNIKLLGIVTFVEPPRTGAIYKADNWECLGETKGYEVKRRGENWIDKQYSKGGKKLIFGYKYNIK